MRKVLFIMFISLIFLLSEAAISMAFEKEIKTLSLTMAENVVKAGKKTIAVADFVDLQGNVTELGRFLAEEFSGALAGAKKGFRLVNRTHLKTIFKEHKLASAGVIDPTTAKKLGQILGVDALVTGTITPLGDSVRLVVKILDTANGEEIDALSGNIPRTKAIDDLLGRGVETETQTSTHRPERKAISRVDAQEFTFEVQSCRLSGQAVTCNLIVTNRGNDTVLQFGYRHRTRIFDDNGNEYHMETVRLGNQQSQRYEVKNKMVSDIPVKASLSFEKVSPQIGRINLLEIGCARNFDGFTVQFRNISLSR